MRKPFQTRLDEGVVLFDGGMGTMIYQKGVFINCCFDELNIKNPELIREIHRDYALSGAEVLETNTFGANAVKLRPFGLASAVKKLNLAGARLAREVAGDDLYVAGSVGPLGVPIEPVGIMSREEARACFRAQVCALLEGGVDLILLETFPNLEELVLAVEASLEVIGHLPLMTQVVCNEGLTTVDGTSMEVVARTLNAMEGVSVVGLNCGVGPAVLLDALEAMRPCVDKPLSVMPNAGMPRWVEGRLIYLSSPEYMAEYAKRFVDLGAVAIGGCCGTTPGHIAEMRRALSSVRAKKRSMASVALCTPCVEATEAAEPIPLDQRSRWGYKIARRKFVTSVELVPPRGWQMDSVLRHAIELERHGIDAINIPDGPRASSRLSPMIMALLIERRCKIETVLHYCCRDRNLIGIQSDLLGAQAAGIRNILLVTGDPPKIGDYPDVTGVFDVDSIGLVTLASRLNTGRDLGGNPITPPTGLVLGVGVNPAALDSVKERQRCVRKVEAGAEFAISQPVFDAESLLRFLDSIQDINMPLILGLWPLLSLKNAEFMRNEVPGVLVPERVMERMAACKGKDEARREGVAIATEIALAVRDRIAGIQVSAPLGILKLALDVVESII